MRGAGKRRADPADRGAGATLDVGSACRYWSVRGVATWESEDSDGDNLEQQHQGIGEAAHGSHQRRGPVREEGGRLCSDHR